MTRGPRPIWKSAAGITSGRRHKPRTKESGVTCQGKGGCGTRVGIHAREPSCPSEIVSQALEVHGHVRSHSGPMEEDLVGPGHRAAVQDKSKKVKASQDNKS